MSELALQLIEENKKTQATFLDLGNCDLIEIPEEIGELVWLESLSLASVWLDWDNGDWNIKLSKNSAEQNENLKDIKRLTTLINLQKLILANTKIRDLSPLSFLTKLRTLDISATQVINLTPLSVLDSLQNLYVSSTPISDISPLSALSGMQTLNVSGTKVDDLTPLFAMKKLQSLHISNTPASDLSPLTRLLSLKALELSNTPIKDLSPLRSLITQGCLVLWDSYTFKLGIHVKNCPLTNPPPEVVKQGSKAILNYFREREQGGIDYLYEAKLLILGEGGAGKTSLLRRLYQPDLALPTEEETTRGIDIHRQECMLKDGTRFRLNIWDFGGQEIYHTTHQFFLTRRSLYLLVDDTRKNHKSVSDEGFKYWLELIDLFGDHSPVLIFQNEKGGRSKAIDLAGIKGRFDNVMERYGGNLEHPNAARELREAIEYYASHLSHIGDELPAYWIKVREAIEARAEQTAHITQQDYFDIFSEYTDFDRDRALHLSSYLHDLGVFLHFQDDPLLARTVILQNEWATEAVFRMLDDESIKGKLGRFDGEDCVRLWRDSQYADMHPELLALMQRFELCYELPDSSPKTWLAPQLLPPAKPESLSDWGRAEDLVLRYRYDFMPKGLISRLTVRLHRFVRDPELAWVTGVQFEQNGTQVLVEILADGRETELRARGVEHKALLSVVAADWTH